MDEIYWVALNTNTRIGARTLLKLYKAFGKLSKVWKSNIGDLMKAGLEKTQIEAVLDVVKNIDPEKEFFKLTKYNIQVLIYTHENYPTLLKEIPDPPGIIYYRGHLKKEEIALAVVGSRKYTQYGERAVEKIVEPLVQNDIIIVSGLALGIDTLAHRACLDNNGRTIAVLGCGLDQIYPTANTYLADKILQNGGAIISEFPIGMPALKFNFPLRNRIIAGLSLGTVIIEGEAESGSLITARASIEYNREVFAVPGSIFASTSEGPNKLIQMGAKLITSAEDILSELNIETHKKEAENRQIIPDCQEEKVVLQLLQQPKYVDQIIKETGLQSAQINSILIMLEMKGMIKNLGGTLYQIKGKLK